MSNSVTIWLLVIPCIITIAFVYHRIRLRRVWHLKKECEQKSLEQEALLYHSRNLHKQLLVKLNHEVRNPLNGVSGLATLLEETPLTDEQRGYIQSIRNCSRDVMEALNQLFKAAGITNNEETEKRTIQNEMNSAASSSVKLSEQFATLFPLKILVAEDDAMNQQLALMILKKLGYLADIAPNGKDVLEMVSEKKYDLILMDVQMPEMDGLEATRMIRLCLNVQPVIIAMTANAMDGDKEKCIDAGMDDYLSKPVNINELVQLLEKWALQVKEKR